jgi:RNA polymerase sigma-70 factor (ECF subfamily)
MARNPQGRKPETDSAATASIAFAERVERSADHVEDLDTVRMVLRFQAGDGDSFAAIYGRYFDRVYGYLRVLLRDMHRAEDVAQQVFMQAFEALPAYEHRGRPFEAWLFTIVRNTALMALRRDTKTDVVDPAELGRRRERVGSRDDNGDGERESSLPDWITDQDLLVLMERMPLAQRQVLLLRFMLGLNAGEIAEILDRSPEAVRMQQSRALAFLRHRLTALGRTPSRRERTRMERCARQAPVLRHRRYALFL